jgi:predicted ATPase
MLTKIALKNFKCFQEEREFPLSHINLLTGINGTGKSTLLQSLLLMYQSLEINPSTTGLFLNGSCLSLGNYEDIKNSNTTRDEAIEIKHQIYLDIFQNSQNNKLLLDLNYAFGEESKDEMVLKIKEIYHKLIIFKVII